MASPYTIDVGTMFPKYQDMYRQAVDMQEDALAQVREVRATVAEVRPRLAPKQLAEVEALLARAAGVEAEAGSLTLQIMADTVANIGDTLTRVRASRARIVLGTEGLAELDNRIATVGQRYHEVYRPMFPIENGAVLIPNAASMGDQEWDLFNRRLRDPIYFWSPKECLEQWNVAGVPPCIGPDLFTTLSMVNEVHVALEHQIEMRRDFPLFSFIEENFGNFIDAIVELAGHMIRIVKAITKIITKVVEAVADVVEAVADTPGWLLLAGAGGLGYLMLRRRR